MFDKMNGVRVLKDEEARYYYYLKLIEGNINTK
jgi:hypothetical protein